MIEEIAALFAGLYFTIFGDALIIGLFGLGVIFAALIMAGKTSADMMILAVGSGLLLFASYGFLPSYFRILGVIATAMLVFLALNRIWNRK